MTVIWDFNGTLLDDGHISFDLTNKQLVGCGYKPMKDMVEYKNKFCFPVQNYYKNVGFNFDDHPFDILAVEYQDMYTQEYKKSDLHQNVKQVLQQLNQKGVRQIILSAAKKDILNEQLEHYGIKHYFDTILGLDDVYANSKVQMAKKWMEQTNFDGSNAIYVGDTTHDFEVAQELNVKCILFTGGHQSDEILKNTGAHVITNLTQVLNLVNI